MTVSTSKPPFHHSITGLDTQIEGSTSFSPPASPSIQRKNAKSKSKSKSPHTKKKNGVPAPLTSLVARTTTSRGRLPRRPSSPTEPFPEFDPTPPEDGIYSPDIRSPWLVSRDSTDYSRGVSLDSLGDDPHRSMSSIRPLMQRPTEGRSTTPLILKKDKVDDEDDERGRAAYGSPNGSARPLHHSRRSTFRSRSPDMTTPSDTRTKWIYAGFFLVLSLISFVVQTETAVYIQHTLGWRKAYCML